MLEEQRGDPRDPKLAPRSAHVSPKRFVRLTWTNPRLLATSFALTLLHSLTDAVHTLPTVRSAQAGRTLASAAAPRRLRRVAQSRQRGWSPDAASHGPEVGELPACFSSLDFSARENRFVALAASSRQEFACKIGPRALQSAKDLPAKDLPAKAKPDSRRSDSPRSMLHAERMP